VPFHPKLANLAHKEHDTLRNKDAAMRIVFALAAEIGVIAVFVGMSAAVLLSAEADFRRTHRLIREQGRQDGPAAS
jgi:hypothetical protein